MNNLLTYEGKQLSVLTGRDIKDVDFLGDVLFCAREVAKILGYKNDRDAVLKHVDAMDKVKIKNSNVVKSDFRKIHNTGEIFINESGMYSLILNSELDSAKKFKHWVTSEVLPTIRKTGQYHMTEKEDQIGSIIETLIESKLNDRLSKYKVKEIEELIALFRAYGMTKKKAVELTHKAVRLNSTPETVLNGYLQDLREEEISRYSGQIKAYIRDITKLGYNSQSAWFMFADEVVHKTGKDISKVRNILKVKNMKATYIDAAKEAGVLKESVSIIRTLAKRLEKEHNKQTA